MGRGNEREREKERERVSLLSSVLIHLSELMITCLALYPIFKRII